ncbi:class I SAM-dependent methyltransferase [Thermodesulfobacteriota bacterium]
MLKYLRFKLFLGLLVPFASYSRKRRSILFKKIMKINKDMKILDLGGQPKIWDNIDIPLEITCLNLPGIADTTHKSHHKFTYIVGDACRMPEFSLGQYDIVFSNSVIEHVGSLEKRIMFAGEVKRLCENYWIQTPYKYYPIEAHCGMPFWWLYPKALRSKFIERWRKKLPAWSEAVNSTNVVSVREMKELFPGATLIKEWVVFPKSIIVYSRT